MNIVLSPKAVPTVISPNGTGDPQGRCGIVFAYISPDNKMPIKPWTGIKAYPSSESKAEGQVIEFTFFCPLCF